MHSRKVLIIAGMKTKIFWLCVLLLTAVCARAQQETHAKDSLRKLSAIEDLRAADSIYRANYKPKDFAPKGWQNGEEYYVRQHYENNSAAVAPSRLDGIMGAFYKQGDFFLFGEDHEMPVGSYFTKLSIAEFNKTAEEESRFKHIFLEQHKDTHPLAAGDMAAFEECFKKLSRKTAPMYCDSWLRDKLHFSQRNERDIYISYSHCLLAATGAKIHFVDMDKDHVRCEGEECGRGVYYLSGSGISCVSGEGLGLRNCAMAENIKNIIAQNPGGKSAYFGGAAHLGNGAANGTLTLTEELERIFPKSKIFSFFVTGGKFYYLPQMCAECFGKTLPRPQKADYRALTVKHDFLLIITPVVPRGVTNEERGEYADNKFADFVLVFPHDYGFEGRILLPGE